MPAEDKVKGRLDNRHITSPHKLLHDRLLRNPIAIEINIFAAAHKEGDEEGGNN